MPTTFAHDIFNFFLHSGLQIHIFVCGVKRSVHIQRTASIDVQSKAVFVCIRTDFSSGDFLSNLHFFVCRFLSCNFSSRGFSSCIFRTDFFSVCTFLCPFISFVLEFLGINNFFLHFSSIYFSSLPTYFRLGTLSFVLAFFCLPLFAFALFLVHPFFVHTVFRPRIFFCLGVFR